MAFPRPIEVTTPSGGMAHDIEAPMEWTLSTADRADPELFVRITLSRTGDEEVAHRVYLPPSTTSAVVPPLPTALSTEEIYGTGRLNAVLEHCVPHESARGLCGRWSSGLPVLVTP